MDDRRTAVDGRLVGNGRAVGKLGPLVAGERLRRILDALYGDGGPASRLCEVSTRIVDVSGAGIMLMSGDIPQGSLCSTNDVSALIEDLQYTLGEGPCVDAYHRDEVVLEPDLASPVVRRWSAFAPAAIDAGVRAVFGFPLRIGVARLGAVNLYRDRPGPLSDDQHADALVMAGVAAHWVLDVQAGAAEGALAGRLEDGADFHYLVQNAAGMVSVQLGVSVTEALIRLRAFAFSHERPLGDVARDVVSRAQRLD